MRRAVMQMVEGVPNSAGQTLTGDERGQPAGIIADTDQEV
jgi:hypothetical protein